MEFFTDRDLGGAIFPNLLQQAGQTGHRHVDHFAPDAPDEQWLPTVAARGWIILSADQNILRTPLERDAVMNSGAALFILIGGNAPAAELAANFINTLPRITAFLDEHQPPFIAKVYRPNPRTDIGRGRPGTVELKLP